jgi:hypothetical protein
MKFLKIEKGPFQFAIIRSGWLSHEENGYYYMILENAEDGNLARECATLKKDAMIEKYPYTQKWFDSEEVNIAAPDYTVKQLKNLINEVENCLVCAAIADPLEVCQNSLKIIEDANIAKEDRS